MLLALITCAALLRVRRAPDRHEQVAHDGVVALDVLVEEEDGGGGCGHLLGGEDVRGGALLPTITSPALLWSSLALVSHCFGIAWSLWRGEDCAGLLLEVEGRGSSGGSSVTVFEDGR